MRRAALVPLLVLAAVIPQASATPLQAAPDVTAEATGPGGAVVTFAQTGCSPASGSVFPLGTTAVSGCDDGSGFNVVVRDTTPPTIDVPAPATLVFEAGGPDGASVTYPSPRATDLVDGAVATQCAPLPGGVFALGSTDVACTAKDAAGNEATLTFPIQVVDRTPPVLTVPGDVAVAAASSDGTPAANAALTAFLTAAVATDIVSGRVDVDSDAPVVFPVGTTIVTFTASDVGGNTATATARVTVLAPEAPPPAPQPFVDRTPPDDVKSLAASAGNAVVRLTWAPPAARDFDHVVVVRTSADGAEATVVYTGRGTSYVDYTVLNDVGYRYTVVAYDGAGNRSAGAVASATPRFPLLLSPLDGGRVKKPPTLRWKPVAGATYYNVQLFRGATKILSAWPKSAKYQLVRGWRFAGKKQTLSPGTYRWYVWPGLGARKDVRYGSLLGQQTFVVGR